MASFSTDPRLAARLVAHAALWITTSLLLTACEPDAASHVEAAREVRAKLSSTASALSLTETDMRGFLIGDSRARLCRVEQENKALSDLFDIKESLEKHIREAQELEQHGVPVPPYADPESQIASHRAILADAESALNSAREFNETLRASIISRDAFKFHADQAWYAIVERTDALVPWFNRQKEAGGQQAELASAEMRKLLVLVDDAKQVSREIERGFAAASGGRLYNCSAWAIATTRLDELARQIGARVDDLESRWKPAN